MHGNDLLDKPRGYGRWAYIAFPVLAIAVILVLWFPSVPIANNQIDLWYNFGMFYDYPSALHWFAGSRQVSRLLVILPGYLLTKAFGSITVAYILFFAYYVTSLVFFYHAARRLLTRNVAVLATIFLATSANLIAAYSTTLADSPAIVYGAVSLYFVAFSITTKSRRRAQLAMFLAGVAGGLAINCHLVIVPYLAANYVIYAVAQVFFTNDSPPARRLANVIVGAILSLCGIALATISLGIVIVAFGGQFSQIFNDFAYVPAVEQGLARYYNPNWYRSGAEAGMLIAACLTAILNVASVRRRHGDSANPTIVRGQVAVSIGILAVAAALLVYNALGGPFLDYSSYFVCFLPYLSLSLFSLFDTTRRDRDVTFLIYAAIFYVASIVVVLIKDEALPWLFDPTNQAKAAIVCGLCIAVSYGFLCFRPRTTIRMGAAALYLVPVLALSFISRPEEKVGYYIWSDSRSEAATYRGLYARLDHGMRFLNGLGLGSYPRFWVDMDRMPETAIYPRAFMVYRYQPYFPKIDDGFCYEAEMCRFSPGQYVVVISNSHDLGARADRAFSALHLRITKVASTQMDQHGAPYSILVTRVTGEPGPGAGTDSKP